MKRLPGMLWMLSLLALGATAGVASTLYVMSILSTPEMLFVVVPAAFTFGSIARGNYCE